MNNSQSRILATLRDGGTLRYFPSTGQRILSRADGSVVTDRIQYRTVNAMLDTFGYLSERYKLGVGYEYFLTITGEELARSIRNTVTP